MNIPPPSITCPLCGRTSHHPQDVQHGYCGACGVFHEFTEWRPDPAGVVLGTGYLRFQTKRGVAGLGKVTGRRLDLLAVASTKPGIGQFRDFIRQMKLLFDSIGVWEVWSDFLPATLARYGFVKTERTENGERLTGMEWRNATSLTPATPDPEPPSPARPPGE